MKVDIKMPKLGESITEGTIVKWWKKPGDHIKKDETLLEISTDKVDSEIPSPYEGELLEILKEENETVEVDSVIARIETESKEAAKEAEKTETKEADAEEAAEEKAEAEKAKEQEKAAEAEEEKQKETAQEKPREEEKKKTPQPSTNGGQLIDVKMPKLGESITEGTIVKWWKKPGDQVEKDETLLEISTDKVDSEIPSPYAGVLSEILAEENNVVEVDSVIARIKTGAKAEAAKEATAEEPAKEEAAAEVEEKPAEAKAEPSEPPKVEKPAKGKRFYSPLVLNIARKEGVSTEELESISGSGLEGRVTKKDMLKYVEDKKTGKVEAKAAPERAEERREEKPAAEVSEKWKEQRVEVIPMDAIRKKIADHMVKSKATSPHVYGVAECDFTPVMNIVKKYKSEFEQKEGFKLTFNPFILQATVKALLDFPRVNSSVEGNNIVEKHFINLGIAVATERGLIVPVLKNAEEKNFLGLARTAYDLAMRARNRKLDLEEVQDSTFTITNYGVFGNMIGFPIINQPNVAILGVGAIKKRPVVLETEQGDYIGIRTQTFLTLSYDHRIVDGELGEKFLHRVVHYIESMTEDVL